MLVSCRAEDIIAIVLARMFNYLQQSTNGNNLHARYQEELRGLYREFDKLYQNLCRLRKGGGHFMEGESALRELQTLASSHSTAREFKKSCQPSIDIYQNSEWL